MGEIGEIGEMTGLLGLGGLGVTRRRVGARGAALAFTVGAAMVLGSGGCGRGGSSEPNVLILTLDTTRADRFGVSGWQSARTPNFDRFATEEAVHFENAISAAPITFPSHTTIMTGTYPVTHGVHNNDGYRLDDEVTTLAEILSDAGFDTGAVVASFPLDSQVRLNQGFDVYDDDFQADWSQAELDNWNDLSFGFLERKSDRVNLAFERWLEKHSQNRFFAWVHYFDAHQPLNPAPPYDTIFSTDPYDGEIAFMDENFGGLLEILERHGVRDDTIIVIVGDHGEGLGEHTEPTHASFLYDTTMRVPLWISAPELAARAGSRVPEMVRTLDLTPTVLDLLDLPPAPEAQGRSLRPLLEGRTEAWDEEAILESYYSWFHFAWAPIRALRSGEWKFIDAPKPELYHLSEDPTESRNLFAFEPEKATELAERLARLSRRFETDRPDRSVSGGSDEDTRRKLAALGYLAVTSKPADLAVTFPNPEELAALPNPMDFGLQLSLVSFASELLRSGRAEEGVQTARQGLAEDPNNLSLRESLLRGLAAMGLYDSALEQSRILRTARPDFPPYTRLEASLLSVAGLHQRAIDVTTELINQGTPVFTDLYRMAKAYAELGNTQKAVEHYRAALEQDDGTANFYIDMANSLVELREFDEAREIYQRALERAPYSSTARYFIGQFYRAMGNLEFARQMFEEVLELSPGHLGARVFSARVMLELGVEPDLARQRLEETVDMAPASPQAAEARALLETL